MNIFYLLAQDSDAAAAAAGAAVGGIFLVEMVLGLATYLLVAFSLYTIANKQGANNSWFAFVPILNVLLIIDIAGKEIWWIVLFLIPCVNLVAAIIVMLAFAEKIGKPSWMGILACLPCLSLIAWPMMAFGKD